MIDKTKPYGFQCIPKDLMALSDKMINNEVLCKLLYITNKDALTSKELTVQEKEKLINEEYIQILPKIQIDEDENRKRNNTIQNHIVINFDGLAPSENPMYYDGVLVIDILCHLDNWKIRNRYGEITLRPYEIAHQIMQIVDGKKFTGIGKMNFMFAEQTVLATATDYAGLTMKFNFVNSKYESDVRN